MQLDHKSMAANPVNLGRRSRSIILPLTILVACAVAFYFLRSSQRERINTVVETYTRVFTAKLDERLKFRFMFAELLKTDMLLADRFDEAKILSASRTLLPQLDDMQALNWIGADGVIELVSPLRGNEAALGLDIMSLKIPSLTLKSATSMNNIRITPPITLAQGGRGFTAYLPVQDENQIFGYINLVFRASPLINSAIDDLSRKRFLLSIRDGDKVIFEDPMTEISRRLSSTTSMDVGGRKWIITVAPTLTEFASAQSILDEAVLVCGVLLALAMGLLSYDSELSREKLRDREERFSLALKGATDGIFDWSPATGQCYYSPRWFQMLGYETEDLPSSYDTFISLLHHEDRNRVLNERYEIRDIRNDVLEKEFRMRHRNGSWVNILSRAYVVRKLDGSLRVVGTHVDITERIQRQRELEHAAKTDDLTGLSNRRGMRRALSGLSKSLDEGEVLAIIHLDLDKFKSVNDVLGHEMGDLALKATAERLKTIPGGLDFLARVGGDEFLLAKTVREGTDQTNQLAETLVTAVSAPLSAKGRQLCVGASLGISFARSLDIEQVDEEIANADIALNAAKSLGRGCYQFFEEAMRRDALRVAQMTNEIRLGLERDEFEAFFQPQIELASGKIVGFEALARWRHPECGLLPASSFIDFAAKANLVSNIDDILIDHACKALQSLLPDTGSTTFIAVNMSTAQLNDPALVDRLVTRVDAAGLLPGQLHLEILESTMLSENNEVVSKNLRKLSEAGFVLELDDFGSGHSAISSLVDYPISKIKISQNLINGISKNLRLQKVGEAILELCSSLKVEALAEGVEDVEDLRFLASTNCGYVQGFRLAVPMPLNELNDWLAQQKIGEEVAGLLVKQVT